MAIITCVPDQVLLRHSTGSYNYNTNVFKVALYLSTASLGLGTTAYTTTGELTGGGYTTGGYTLTNVTGVVSDRKLLVTWQAYTTGSLTQTDIAGAMVYNTTVSNEPVYIVNFGAPLVKSSQTLRIVFPDSAAGFGAIQLRAG